MEAGLAYVEALGKAEQRFLNEYKQYEKVAQEKKTGIWGANITIGSRSSSRNNSFKPVNETKSVYVSEAFDPEETALQ